ncbi:type II toxin-antitoxin system PemK/MazF family toxin [Nanoarchaeota archaeon]
MKLFQRDIILLPYPFTDLSGKKVRPALVISNDDYNNETNDCIMVPITSVIKDDPFSISLTQKDLEEGKLFKPSRIKFDKVFSLEKDLVIMKIGKLDSNVFKDIKKGVISLF